MLVLTRKEHERIMVGDGVEIVVLEIRGGKVKLGFRCDASVPVHRHEVYRRLQAEGSLEGALPAEPVGVSVHTP